MGVLAKYESGEDKMRNILIGFILIFLDFNLKLGNSTIGLIPDFIGYIVMIRGLEEMIEESTLFMKIKPVVVGMAVYSGVLYFFDLVGISTSLGVLIYVLALTSTAISLSISYNIVMGVIDMEGKYNILLNGDSLKFTWTIMLVLNIICFVLSLIPPTAIGIICIIATLVVSICFLVAFNNSKNLYYDTVIK
ncbi:MAG: hypothetical protein GX271_08565 [Clostridiales bacterium]|nr:hypothetical protein [Clostridiales bacterium]